MEWAAFILSLTALLLAAGKWAFDIWQGGLFNRKGRRERVSLRVELLAEGSNSFLTRGGSTLVFISLRVYNESEQRDATVSKIEAQIRHNRAWKTLGFCPRPEAGIFPSLIRNALPTHLTPGETDDFYEAFQLDGLVWKTAARVRARVYDYSGSVASVEDNIPHRIDDRPPMDILFQTLDPPAQKKAVKPKE